MIRSALYRRAAQWVITLETGDDLEAQWPRFEAWLAQSEKHKIAYERASRAWATLDRIKAPFLDSRVRSPAQLRWELRQLSRSQLRSRLVQWLLWIGLTGAAALAGLIVISHVWPTLPASPYFTAYGDHHPVRLPEGSTVELNTDSRMSAQLDLLSRRVALLQGEAFFDVAHERRPFEVIVDDLVFSVTGTKFLIRRVDAQKVDALVTQGTVDVARRNPAAANGTAAPPMNFKPLHAGERATITAEGVVVKTGSPADVNRLLAWREGLLSLDCSLDQAVEEFNRYNTRKLKIADDSLAHIPVLGTFRATDLAAFVETLTRRYQIEPVLVGATSEKDGVIYLRPRSK